MGLILTASPFKEQMHVKKERCSVSSAALHDMNITP